MHTQHPNKRVDIEGDCQNPQESLQAMIEAARALTEELRAAGIFVEQEPEIPGNFVAPTGPPEA